MNTLVVGSVAFDTITTPFGHADEALGGSGTYFSLSARFFTKPHLVAVVGEDFTSQHREVLAQKGIDLKGLETKPGKTFRWGGEYSFDLNNRTTLFTHLNVFENFQPSLPETYRNLEYVFLGNIHPLLQQKVLEQITEPKLIGLDTMNYWIENAKDELLRTISLVDVLIVNDSEARELSGEHNLVRAAKYILRAMGTPKRTAPTVIIKRGEYGALIFQMDRWFYAPAFPLEDVFDPTGAGDSFAGGFIGYLAQSGNLSWDAMKKALVYGSVMGSFCVESLGTERFTILTKEEIDVRFKQMQG